MILKTVKGSLSFHLLYLIFTHNHMATLENVLPALSGYDLAFTLDVLFRILLQMKLLTSVSQKTAAFLF